VDADYEVLIVGSGAAGLAAALGAAERARDAGRPVSIALIERSAEADRGGNTRYSPAYMRLESPDRLAARFEDDMLDVSGGRSDRAIVARLARDAVETLAWVQGHGITFHRPVTYFLTAAAPRIQPAGGGAAVVETLATAARHAGVATLFETTAQRLNVAGGTVCGLDVRDADGRTRTLRARAVILACGGYESSPEMLAASIGAPAANLRAISRGTTFNRGEGIRMALEAGARRSGDWDGFHCEPVDPRSTAPEAVVLTYPYGIVVNRAGKRFFDEGAARVDETWETLARTIAFTQDGAIAYAIFDQRLYGIRNYDRAIKSDVPPVRAGSILELARALGVDPEALAATVDGYNAAAIDDETKFDPTRMDGLRALYELEIPKSNWARPIDRPPYYAYPLVGAIAYTFGGLEANEEAEVLREDGTPLPGLYAAGEINGLFFNRAPGGTSVLRGLVFGRIAGRNAIDYAAAAPQPGKVGT
jgi:tricarballylate dehydrogenase